MKLQCFGCDLPLLNTPLRLSRRHDISWSSTVIHVTFLLLFSGFFFLITNILKTSSIKLNSLSLYIYIFAQQISMYRVLLAWEPRDKWLGRLCYVANAFSTLVMSPAAMPTLISTRNWTWCPKMRVPCSCDGTLLNVMTVIAASVAAEAARRRCFPRAPQVRNDGRMQCLCLA